jgi:hypothetical protein
MGRWIFKRICGAIPIRIPQNLRRTSCARKVSNFGSRGWLRDHPKELRPDTNAERGSDSRSTTNRGELTTKQHRLVELASSEPSYLRDCCLLIKWPAEVVRVTSTGLTSSNQAGEQDGRG